MFHEPHESLGVSPMCLLWTIIKSLWVCSRVFGLLPQIYVIHITHWLGLIWLSDKEWQNPKNGLDVVNLDINYHNSHKYFRTFFDKNIYANRRLWIIMWLFNIIFYDTFWRSIEGFFFSFLTLSDRGWWMGQTSHWT